jgi:hypothetical protein
MTVPGVSLQHPSAGTCWSRRGAGFIPASGKRRHNIADHSQIRPSATRADPGPPSSAAPALTNRRKMIFCQHRRVTKSP